jgi:hypothetical protein
VVSGGLAGGEPGTGRGAVALVAEDAMTDYAIVQLRELAKKMIFLEHAARQALERGDQVAARQLWFERVQITSLRSAKLREYWNTTTPSVD